MRRNTWRPLSLLVLALAALFLAGCGQPEEVKPGKNDTPQQAELRKEKSGDD